MAKKKQGVRKSVGTASGLAGIVVGSAAAVGKKIVVGSGKGIAVISRSLFSVGMKGTPRTAGKTTTAPEPSEVEESEVSPPESEFFSLESVSQHDADMETRAKELEFELVDAQKELDQAHHKATEAQSHLTSQLNILQKKMMSPLFDPKNTQAKQRSSRTADPAPRHNVDTEARAKKLESELAKEQKSRSHLMSQLNIMQRERESVVEDLNDARDEADNARDRIRAIESELKEAQCRLEDTQEQQDEVASSHEVSDLSEVTPDDVCNALFSIESEREIVQRSMSDIADGNEETRNEAARALGSVHHELAVRVLSNRLQREPSERVRAECVCALTDLGMTEGLSAVERTLTDPAACVRLAAVKGVYRLAGKKSVPMLMSALSDENDSVRYRAGVLAGWLGRNDVASEMRKMLKNQARERMEAAK